MTALNLAELGIIAEHFCLRADLDRYDENSPTQLFVHCPFDKPHPVSDAVLGLDCIAGVVVRICELCELEVEDSFAEVAQGLREASVDYVTSGRAAYVGVADLLEGAERPRSRSALLYLVGVDDLHISESMLRELYAVPDTVVLSEDELHQRAAVIRGVLDISECLAGTVRQLMDFQRRFQPVWGALFDRWVRERGVSGGAWSEWFLGLAETHGAMHERLLRRGSRLLSRRPEGALCGASSGLHGGWGQEPRLFARGVRAGTAQAGGGALGSPTGRA